MAVLALAAFGLGAGAFLTAQTPPANVMLQAMRDELDRSRKLTVPNLETPYFIQYAIDEGEIFSVSATLGGIVTRRRDRFRVPGIEVRVGDYKFDNTNYFAGGFFGSRYDMGRFPVEDDYAVLRRFLWLETDSAYKSAVEAISRKRAALRNLTVSDQINDFAHAEPVKYYRDLRRLAIDERAWTDRVRSLSAIFDHFPEVRASEVELESGEGGYYLVTSEGTELRMRDGVTFLRVRAGAQAPDGMLVRDAAVFHSLDAVRMPLDPELRRGITVVAENVVALAHAPRGDDYSGPVLFEGVAAAQLFAEVLGRNLALTRRPVTEPGRPGGFPASELEGRQGARILPEWMDVVDDPSQVEWRGRPLFGSYEVDREGVPAKPLRLVEKGVLKDFLRTRQPVRGYEGSNGRARMPGNFGAALAGPGNLFVSAAEGLPPAELKKQMLELIRARNKPYGVIVRKMDFPSSASFEEVRRLLSGSQPGSARPVSLPALAYRIYPDGREELVRGVRFRGLNARSLKDILAAGNDATVFDYLDNGAPFAVMGAGNFAAETCVVAPSVLIDDLELHPLEDELPKLPVVPPPELVH
jgi:predicted Zn-dependent protease